ncbi:hypothetical protein EJ377_16090 [Chryseobacterium arthrosphaerae]|uniref:Uncharacterized protein n=1 Tax=Chryseobacterium arthrosphaerae TaxID=651561 RepID=A0A3S0N4R2_9FLAO|nr:hypothetical protein EJ377_16090 [Chryseobacterium arthrosphaerae]
MNGEYSFDFDLIGSPIANSFNNFPILKDLVERIWNTNIRQKYICFKRKKDNNYKPVVDGGNVGDIFLNHQQNMYTLVKKL